MFRPRGLSLKTLWHLLRKPALRPPTDRAVHVFLCIVDHFEPMVDRVGIEHQRQRIDRWVREYPQSVTGMVDSRGRLPQHTFFYPAEEYNPEHLDKLAALCRKGLGDVEVHLHHDNDSAENLRHTLETFRDRLFHTHGLLRKDSQGRISYGFVHGNWALCNSQPDGRWCGVNNELSVLRETGCYADFTMPSAPSPTQTRMVNSIYYATDNPRQTKSHDTGTTARVGNTPPERSLLLVQGPLMLDGSRRKYGLLPKLENGDLQGKFPPTLDRLALWLRAGVSVTGCPDWIFVKLHTHGAPERNANMLLGEPMRQFRQSLSTYAAENPWLQYYYVTAQEMAQLVHQAERGKMVPEWADLVH